MNILFKSILVLYLLLQVNSVAVANGTIETRSVVSKEFDPEIVVVMFGVETQNLNPKLAADKNKEISNNVIKALSSFINKDNGDILKTTYYSVSPKYSYVDKKQKLDYYKAVHEIKIEVSDIDLAGNIIDAAINNGANNIKNIYFKLKDTKTNCRELLKQASYEAKLEASDIVSMMGTKLKGIKEINYSCSPNSHFVRGYRYKAAAIGSKSESESSTSIESSNIKLNATVNAEFYVGKMK